MQANRVTRAILVVFANALLMFSCTNSLSLSVEEEASLAKAEGNDGARAVTGFEAPFTRTLQLVSPNQTGNDVKLLQTMYNDWARASGRATLVVDGSFGSVTNTAIRTFQAAQGLVVDGVAGPVTLAKMIDVFTLGSTFISPYSRSLSLVSPQMTGSDVSALQQAYNVWASRTGRSSLYVDGVFGTVTKNAVLAFQNAERRLLADGVAGKQTQRLLAVRSWTGTAAGAIPNSTWGRPMASYTVTQEFKGASVHNGIDLAAPYGTAIYAARAGRVKAILEGYLTNGSTTSTALSGWALDPVYKMSGDKVVLQHADGKLSIYDHVGQASGLYVGQDVSKGQLVGYINRSGNRTGPHLHFAIFLGNTADTAVNPRNYISF